MSRRTLISTLAAAALSVAIAGPALAGPPTYSGGPIVCSLDGELRDMGFPFGWPDRTSWTRKEINDTYRFWVSADQCDPGTLDMSAFTQD